MNQIGTDFFHQALGGAADRREPPGIHQRKAQVRNVYATSGLLPMGNGGPRLGRQRDVHVDAAADQFPRLERSPDRPLGGLYNMEYAHSVST